MRSFPLKVRSFDAEKVTSKNDTKAKIVEWDAKHEDQSDVNVWEDNWDDDAIEDDFSTQLRYVSRGHTLTHSLCSLARQ